MKGEPTLYAKVKPEDVKSIVESHFQPPGFISKLKNKIYQFAEDIQTDRNWDGVQRYEISMREKPVASFLGKQIPIATEYRGILSILLMLMNTLKGVGFTALKKMFGLLSPDEVDSTGKK
jgi:NADH-quinone oxidoreductase subunit F